MRCSTIAPAIAVPIRRTAGCFSIRSISTSRNWPDLRPDHDADHRNCDRSDLVDYAAVAGLKWRALRSAFESFKGKASGAEHAGFRTVSRRARRVVIAVRLLRDASAQIQHAWWEWPEVWRQPDEARCAQLRQGPDGAEIEFVEFVQWIADRQLRACRDRAAELGMKVGLYLDVAVGVQSGGFDAWNEQAAISRHLSVGAPPDALNTAGQNWGLAGFNAAGLKLTSFEPFRADAAGLDALRRRDPARSCARAEAALSGAARVCGQ